MVDQPEATPRAGRWWLTLLVAAALAALVVVLFAATAFSSSGAARSTGGAPGYRQIQQTPGSGNQGGCPHHSRQQPSGSSSAGVQT